MPRSGRNRGGCRRFAPISAISDDATHRSPREGTSSAMLDRGDTALFHFQAYRSGMITRCWLAFAVAGLLAATPAAAQIVAATPATAEAELKPDIDLYALMSGRCSMLKIAGREFACRAVAYFHSEKGRAHFTVALEDPLDNAHVVSFSGENGRRTKDNLYELRIDRMLLSSKDRPKADGLPVPMVENSAGQCRQVGNFAAREVSSISCTAHDRNGR